VCTPFAGTAERTSVDPGKCKKYMIKIGAVIKCCNLIKNNNWDVKKYIQRLQKKRPHLVTIKGPLDEKGFGIYAQYS